MVFVLDNYDSFTYNLVQYLGELGAEVVVRRNDEVTPEEVEALKPERILLSPGPCTPAEAGILVPLIRHMAGKAPILGVCLGHQAIGEAFGGKVVRAKTLMHGKTSAVDHDGKGVFRGLPTPLTCTRYHSLIVAEESLPAELRVTARTTETNGTSHYGPAPSHAAHRGRAVPSRERADRGRPPDDPQLSGDVSHARCSQGRESLREPAVRAEMEPRSQPVRDPDCGGGAPCADYACGRSRKSSSERAAAPAATSPAATSGAATTPAAQNTTAQSDQAPGFTTPPVAIVPLDKSIRGAALEVDGPIEAWNGRAYLTGSGSITAGTATAEVALPSRGTLRVCASSTVKLAADASAPAGEVPGLLMALDRGAVEMSLAPSTAREKNADTLLTPYFRILIGGPNAADVKVRLGEHGDTCVDNAGAEAPYVVVSSVFDGGIYRVQPGQRVMFERGSLQSVVDQEKEPCGCPPPLAEARGNEFPLAQSEGLAPGSQAPWLLLHRQPPRSVTTAPIMRLRSPRP